MKKLSYHVAMGLGLVSVFVCAAPVLAEEDGRGSFVAISEIERPLQDVVLTPLPDSSLDSIEGAGACFVCPSINVNIVVAPITQFNVINQIAVALGQNITQLSAASAVNSIGGFSVGR